MLKTEARQSTPEIRADRSRRIIAFDGDDTLWIDDTDEKRWERDCQRLSVVGLPHPGMAHAFRRHLREFGYTQEGVQRALIESGREICGGDLPGDWTAQVEAIPQCMQWLTLRCPHGLQRVLQRLRDRGHALWLITKGDLIRQAIKLSCFPYLDQFDVVEIVDHKNTAVYNHVLAANGCAPSDVTMVGDCFREDIVPVVRLGGRAIHVPEGRWALLRPLESLLPTRRIHICRSIEDVPEAIIAAG
jgi:putative hydrolase of the HAD superfamily